MCISSTLKTLADIWQQRRRTALETKVVEITHDVRQPLTSIALSGAAAKHFLEQSPPDLETVRRLLDEVVGASLRVGEAFASNRVLIVEDRPNQ
jgi:signal transduction histidine kinase